MAKEEPAARERRERKVPPEAAAVRLDRFLSESGLVPSRAYGRKLIDEGRVLVGGASARPSRKLIAGETVVVEIPPPRPPSLRPEPIPLEIPYEDDHLLVVNKRPGMVVHPGAGVREGTLVHALLHHCRSLSDGGGPDRPGIVHRLDKETSGLLIVAKDRETHIGLARAIEAREVRRCYRAVVWGNPPDEGTIDAPIGRSPKDRKKMAVLAGGRRAVTHFAIPERFPYACLTDVMLESGRTHQIRVHFAHIGHPVFGDPVYGGRRKALRGIAPERRKSAAKALGTIARQALHAWRIEFTHPRTGRPLRFEAEPPGDMRDLVGFLRAD